jgi:hypothetical protein
MQLPWQATADPQELLNLQMKQLISTKKKPITKTIEMKKHERST